MKPTPESSTQEVLAGLVERVTFHNAENGFCVLKTKARGHRELVTVIGQAATISAGEWITASGEWVNDRLHGQQFKARFLKTSAPTSIVEREALLQPVRDRDQLVAGQRRRRAAAPVHVQVRRPPANQPGNVVDLAHQQRGVGAMRRFEPDDRRVAAAIKTEPVAERHMEVERERRFRRQLSQPAPIDARSDRRAVRR